MGALGSTVPENWFVGGLSGVDGAVSSSGNGIITGTTVQADNGSVPAASGLYGNYNYGATGSSSRSLGSIATTSKGHRAMEVRLQNKMGAAITYVSVSYDGKQWRKENAGPQSLVMKFSTDGVNFVDMGAQFNFTSIVNNAGSGPVDGQTNRTNGIGGVYVFPSPLPDNHIFHLRWFDYNDGGVADHGLAIDNVSVTAYTGQPPVSITRGPYLQSGTPTSVVVRWRTSYGTDSRVRFGTTQGTLDQNADNPAVTAEHEVLVSGLNPNTRYYYSVGTTSEVVAGNDATYFFDTSPPEQTSKSTRIWVLGDSGTADSNQRAVRDAYYAFTGARHTDLWLMLGDNAYNSGTDAEYQAGLFNIYPTMLRKSVLWPTIGNHDTAQSANPPPSLPYFQMFTLPTNAEAGGYPSGTEKYYSFNYGDIHFICLDSMSSSRAPSGTMAQWLMSDLNLPSTQAQHWIIAFWHHPPYTRGGHNSDTDPISIEMHGNIVPILENGGVDLVFTGHSHSYERSVLLDGHYGSSSTLTMGMKLDAGSGRIDGTGAYHKATYGIAPHQGTVYAVAGSSGKISGGPLNYPAMFTSLNVLGSVAVDINGSRLDARFVDSSGATRDYFSIIKGYPSVSISAPSDSAVVLPSEVVDVSAVAGAQGADVTKVEFFAGPALFATDSDSSGGYTATWSSATPGQFALTAKVTDSNGSATTSAPVQVYVAEAQSSAGAARRRSDGTAVALEGLVVSLVVGDGGFFYAQQPDGSAGIRIDSASLPQAGARINVHGLLETLSDGERALTHAVWTADGTGPLLVRGVNNKATGGEGYLGDLWNLTNQGLLVRAWGKVTKAGAGYFLMDDGSEVPSGDTAPGIKVVGAPIPAPGDQVTVVGVVASEAAGGGYIRVLRAAPEP